MKMGPNKGQIAKYGLGHIWNHIAIGIFVSTLPIDIKHCGTVQDSAGSQESLRVSQLAFR